jgi:hypothetical protein
VDNQGKYNILEDGERQKTFLCYMVANNVERSRLLACLTPWLVFSLGYHNLSLPMNVLLYLTCQANWLASTLPHQYVDELWLSGKCILPELHGLMSPKPCGGPQPLPARYLLMLDETDNFFFSNLAGVLIRKMPTPSLTG